MIQQSSAAVGAHAFRALGVSDAVCAVPSTSRASRRRSPSRPPSIPEALRGGDVLAKSPTGSGKTLAFAIPIVERLDPDATEHRALVLVPTRELASQVTEAIAAGRRSRAAIRVVAGLRRRAAAQAGHRRRAERTCSSRRPAGCRTSSTAG